MPVEAPKPPKGGGTKKRMTHLGTLQRQLGTRKSSSAQVVASNLARSRDHKRATCQSGKQAMTHSFFPLRMAQAERLDAWPVKTPVKPVGLLTSLTRQAS